MSRCAALSCTEKQSFKWNAAKRTRRLCGRLMGQVRRHFL
jgi:hypothetical protein